MDFNAIIHAISTTGFPIVMCLLLIWQIKSNAEKHAEEMDKITTAINNNTIALTKLSARFDKKS